MYARMVTAQVENETINETIRIWKEKDIPLMDSVKGYRGAYLLTDPEAGKAISITLWDSKEDSVADEQSTLHQKQLDMYKDLLVGDPPVTQYYEVSALDKIV